MHLSFIILMFLLILWIIWLPSSVSKFCMTFLMLQTHYLYRTNIIFFYLDYHCSDMWCLIDHQSPITILFSRWACLMAISEALSRMTVVENEFLNEYEGGGKYSIGDHGYCYSCGGGWYAKSYITIYTSNVFIFSFIYVLSLVI